MAEHPAPNEFEYSIATVPPTRLQRWWAFGVIGWLLLVFAALVPFASIQLARENGFIPAVQGIIFVADLATAVLLFNEFAIVSARELLVLADAYLFSALIVVPYGLSFPGAFAAIGIFSQSLETAPWLTTFGYCGFSVAALVYAGLKDGRKSNRADRSSGRAAICWNVFIVMGLVCLLTWIATRAEIFLPHLMRNEMQFAPIAHYVMLINFLVCLAALIVLFMRGWSLLDLGLAVVLVALVARLASAIFITSRFSVAFYVNRVFSIVIATAVLLVLLSQMMQVHGRLSNAHRRLRRERESKLTNLEAAMAAVSHEIRQPLTAIVSNGMAAQNFLKRTPPDIGDVRNLVEQMVQSGYRAAAVLDNIRALFKPGDHPDSHSIRINELISEGLQILRVELESCGILVRARLDPGLPCIVGHKGQLQEVILNLVQNSIDALKITEGRKRLIEVQTEKLDQKTIAISVNDSGPGIDPGRISNIFEAFATTKTDGMGLGLAISQMIIERHGGAISAGTNPSGGVRMEIKLPVAPEATS